ncbi:hypothetical protein QIH93_37145 [Bradyrhizobium ottawaense]|uniref:Uncharacterized protein n=1 Tax=Bradyrhizobium ottawaense TaxID=931866 RepID=A0ABV4FPB1_9BRAD|nr:MULTISPECIES: hypothetical protein [Bradyrhizobium]MBR1292925.1 hypothetical protein [Bradyrhizobium ottawaense]WLB46040.1 hypothetical protein QIH93_37145 [Bradyrhizobium ottawaense]WQN83370.1 hypothetical protein U7859_02490 [Bradyrhizobium ottawaense]BBO01949.1 hypothetical protein SG09_12990 [Bradyrhizobium ottawaense]GMO47985.1 hypothetical protein BwSH14_66190 [Bradyrhizobium ottawaense]
MTILLWFFPQELIDQFALKEGDEIEIAATGGSTTTAETEVQRGGLRENRRVELWPPTDSRNPLICQSPSTVHGVVFDVLRRPEAHLSFE